MRFEDKPDYKYLKQLFRDLFVREGFAYDYVYDWCKNATRGNTKSRSRKVGKKEHHADGGHKRRGDEAGKGPDDDKDGGGAM